MPRTISVSPRLWLFHAIEDHMLGMNAPCNEIAHMTESVFNPARSPRL